MDGSLSSQPSYMEVREIAEKFCHCLPLSSHEADEVLGIITSTEVNKERANEMSNLLRLYDTTTKNGATNVFNSVQSMNFWFSLMPATLCSIKAYMKTVECKIGKTTQTCTANKRHYQSDGFSDPDGASTSTFQPKYRCVEKEVGRTIGKSGINFLLKNLTLFIIPCKLV